MIPGRKYHPEDLLAIAWGYKWFLVVPLLLGAIGMAIHSRSLPNVYESQAVIQVVPQGIPETFVRSTVTAQIDQRLVTISQQILSRSRLESMVTELDLYREERARGTMQDAVERMQRDIQGPTVVTQRRALSGRSRQNGASFVIGFTSNNSRTALQVTERLASMFIEENLRQRTGQAEVTDKFLESQLENARVVLEGHERRLEEFRRGNANSLPAQLSANTSGLQATQNQINNLVEKTVHDRERHLMLERQIADLTGLEILEASTQPVVGRRGQTSVPVGAASRPQPSGSNTPRPVRNGQGSGSDNRAQQGTQPRLLADDAETGSAAEQLERARQALTAMGLRLKPDHPDMGIAGRRIAELEKRAEEEALQAPLSTSGTSVAGLSPAELQRQQQLKALREELEMLARQVTRREGEEKGLREKLAVYQARIEGTPARETELTALTRDYDTFEGQYQQLLKKKADSKLATELESRQISEQFRIVEPAREAQRPSSPDRPRLMAMGSLSGFVCGLLLVGLLEYRDRSFKTDADVMAALSLPVLAMVPTIVTSGDRRRRVRRRLALTGSVVAIVMLVSFTAWKFQMFSRWLQ